MCSAPSANKSFFLLFGIAILVAVVGLLCIFVAKTAGWVTFGSLAGLAAIGHFTGKSDALMTLGVALVSGVCGVLTLIVAAYHFMGA